MAKGIPLPVTVTNLDAEISNAVKKVGTINIPVSVDPTAFKKLAQPLGRVSGLATEFEKSIAASNARVLAFGASVGIINGVQNAFASLLQTGIEVQKTLAEIAAISGQSGEALAKFGDSLFEIGKLTGQSFKTAAQAALEFSRQGLSTEETLKRTTDALTLTRFTTLNAAEAVDILTAAANSFGDTGITTTEILNKLVAVDTKFAVSAEDLANGLARAGSIAQEVGVSFDELNAAITVAQERTARGGSVIGNALKTIFTRLRSDETVQALRAIGVESLNAQGGLKGAIPLLEEVAQKLEGLSEGERVQILEAIASKYNINILSAILTDLSDANKKFGEVVGISASAGNQAYERQIQLNETLAAQINVTTVSVQQLFNKLAEIGVTESLGNLLKFVNGLLDGINKILDSESTGGNIAKGLIKGISEIFFTVGLPLLGAIFIKLTKDIAQFGVESLKTILGINQQVRERQALEQAVVNTLIRDQEIMATILSLSGNRAKQEEYLLSVYNRQLAALQQVQSIAAGVAPALQAAGLSATSGTVKRRAAEGYLPAAEARDVRRGVGGASPSSKVVEIPNFSFGGGKRGTMVANTSEYIVPNYAGGSGTAIFNQDMAKEYGLPPGAKKITASGGFVPASGFVPNFADSGLKGIGGLQGKELPYNVKKNLTPAEAKKVERYFEKTVVESAAKNPYEGQVDVAHILAGRIFESRAQGLEYIDLQENDPKPDIKSGPYSVAEAKLSYQAGLDDPRLAKGGEKGDKLLVPKTAKQDENINKKLSEKGVTAKKHGSIGHSFLFAKAKELIQRYRNTPREEIIKGIGGFGPNKIPIFDSGARSVSENASTGYIPNFINSGFVWTGTGERLEGYDPEGVIPAGNATRGKKWERVKANYRPAKQEELDAFAAKAAKQMNENISVTAQHPAGAVMLVPKQEQAAAVNKDSQSFGFKPKDGLKTPEGEGINFVKFAAFGVNDEKFKSKSGAKMSDIQMRIKSAIGSIGADVANDFKVLTKEPLDKDGFYKLFDKKQGAGGSVSAVAGSIFEAAVDYTLNPAGNPDFTDPDTSFDVGSLTPNLIDVFDIKGDYGPGTKADFKISEARARAFADQVVLNKVYKKVDKTTGLAKAAKGYIPNFASTDPLSSLATTKQFKNDFSSSAGLEESINTAAKNAYKPFSKRRNITAGVSKNLVGNEAGTKKFRDALNSGIPVADFIGFQAATAGAPRPNISGKPEDLEKDLASLRFFNKDINGPRPALRAVTTNPDDSEVLAPASQFYDLKTAIGFAKAATVSLTQTPIGRKAAEGYIPNFADLFVDYDYTIFGQQLGKATDFNAQKALIKNIPEDQMTEQERQVRDAQMKLLTPFGQKLLQSKRPFKLATARWNDYQPGIESSLKGLGFNVNGVFALGREFSEEQYKVDNPKFAEEMKKPEGERNTRVKPRIEPSAAQKKALFFKERAPQIATGDIDFVDNDAANLQAVKSLMPKINTFTPDQYMAKLLAPQQAKGTKASLGYIPNFASQNALDAMRRIIADPAAPQGEKDAAASKLAQLSKVTSSGNPRAAAQKIVKTKLPITQEDKDYLNQNKEKIVAGMGRSFGMLFNLDALEMGDLNYVKRLDPSIAKKLSEIVQKQGGRDSVRSLIDFGSAARGYIPNFAENEPLKEAINREVAAGVSPARVRVTQDDRLQNSKNPEGLAVINTRDEPNGKIPNNFRKRAAVQEVASKGFVPNFAKESFDVGVFGKTLDKEKLKEVQDELNKFAQKLKAGNNTQEEFNAKGKEVSDRLKLTGATLDKYNAELKMLGDAIITRRLAEGKAATATAAAIPPAGAAPAGAAPAAAPSAGGPPAGVPPVAGPAGAAPSGDGKSGKGLADSTEKTKVGLDKMFYALSGITTLSYTLQSVFKDSESAVAKFTIGVASAAQTASQFALAGGAIRDLTENLADKGGAFATLGKIGKYAGPVGAVLGAGVGIYQMFQQENTQQRLALQGAGKSEAEKELESIRNISANEREQITREQQNLNKAFADKKILETQKREQMRVAASGIGPGEDTSEITRIEKEYDDKITKQEGKIEQFRTALRQKVKAFKEKREGELKREAEAEAKVIAELQRRVSIESQLGKISQAFSKAENEALLTRVRNRIRINEEVLLGTQYQKEEAALQLKINEFENQKEDSKRNSIKSTLEELKNSSSLATVNEAALQKLVDKIKNQESLLGLEQEMAALGTKGALEAERIVKNQQKNLGIVLDSLDAKRAELVLIDAYERKSKAILATEQLINQSIVDRIRDLDNLRSASAATDEERGGLQRQVRVKRIEDEIGRQAFATPEQNLRLLQAQRETKQEEELSRIRAGAAKRLEDQYRQLRDELTKQAGTLTYLTPKYQTQLALQIDEANNIEDVTKRTARLLEIRTELFNQKQLPFSYFDYVPNSPLQNEKRPASPLSFSSKKFIEESEQAKKLAQEPFYLRPAQSPFDAIRSDLKKFTVETEANNAQSREFLKRKENAESTVERLIKAQEKAKKDGNELDAIRLELAIKTAMYEERIQQIRANSPAAAGLTRAFDDLNKEAQGFTEKFSYDTTFAFRDGLRDALGAAISQTDDLNGALQNVAINFLRTMQNMFLNQAANNLLRGLGNAFPSIIPNVSTNSKGGYIKGYADGGKVIGGSGIRDDVPAMLSAGEYVIRKSAVRKYGESNLEMLNNGGVPKMANGGGFFLPGVRGGSAISGYKDLTAFANQTTTSGATDVLKGGRSTAFANLEDQSQRLSAYALLNQDDVINQEVRSAQEQGLNLIKQREAYRKAQRKAFQQAVVSTIASAAINYGASKIGPQVQSQTISQQNYVPGGSTMTPYIVRGAYGGLIKRYNAGGGPTDDIPALLMGGEYVMSRQTTRKYGKQFFDSINQGRAPRFAEGGSVPTSESSYAEKAASSSETKSRNAPNVTININVTKDSSTTESQGDTEDGDINYKKMSEQIKMIVLDTINEEKRLGGSLRSRS